MLHFWSCVVPVLLHNVMLSYEVPGMRWAMVQGAALSSIQCGRFVYWMLLFWISPYNIRDKRAGWCHACHCRVFQVLWTRRQMVAISPRLERRHGQSHSLRTLQRHTGVQRTHTCLLLWLLLYKVLFRPVKLCVVRLAQAYSLCLFHLIGLEQTWWLLKSPQTETVSINSRH